MFDVLVFFNSFVACVLISHGEADGSIRDAVRDACVLISHDEGDGSFG